MNNKMYTYIYIYMKSINVQLPIKNTPKIPLELMNEVDKNIGYNGFNIKSIKNLKKNIYNK